MSFPIPLPGQGLRQRRRFVCFIPRPPGGPGARAVQALLFAIHHLYRPHAFTPSPPLRVGFISHSQSSYSAGTTDTFGLHQNSVFANMKRASLKSGRMMATDKRV